MNNGATDNSKGKENDGNEPRPAAPEKQPCTETILHCFSTCFSSLDKIVLCLFYALIVFFLVFLAWGYPGGASDRLIWLSMFLLLFLAMLCFTMAGMLPSSKEGDNNIIDRIKKDLGKDQKDIPKEVYCEWIRQMEHERNLRTHGQRGLHAAAGTLALLAWLAGATFLLKFFIQGLSTAKVDTYAVITGSIILGLLALLPILGVVLVLRDRSDL